MRMNPEIKAKWVADLRSGKYKQGRRMLNSSNGFCCLGVLCEQAVDAGVVVRTAYEPIDDSDDFKSWSYGKPGDDYSSFNAHSLPNEVKTWAGLSTQFPQVRAYGFHALGLTQLNDNEELSFQEIAGLIENDEEI